MTTAADREGLAEAIADALRGMGSEYPFADAEALLALPELSDRLTKADSVERMEAERDRARDDLLAFGELYDREDTRVDAEIRGLQADLARLSAEVEAVRAERDEAVSHLPEGLRGTSLAGAVQALAFSARTENDSKWRWGHALTIGLAFADKAAGEEWEDGGMASIDVCHAMAATLGCECDSGTWEEMAKAGAERLAGYLALSRAADKAETEGVEHGE